MTLIRAAILLSVVWVTTLVCEAQSAADTTAADRRALSTGARDALRQQDYKTAARLAGELADAATDDEDRLSAADTLLRCGDVRRATELFDQYIAAQPRSKPYLWQRGIALYFVGRYADGAQQFEVHRKVNPHDVENAAWHYLCVAKQDSAAKAKQLLLPAPSDPRPPMEEVLAMLNSGDIQAVKDRMASFSAADPDAKSAQFYGEFYLGLYADAQGDQAAAKKHLSAAAKHAPANYMGDIAKVYADHLNATEAAPVAIK
ncbi:tetratricopeptide repeat protein [Stieleria sp. TO1_6]|uniref:tetratricopeptide repeat protein n=1 Tax=Stieleria tagensis TaxID=2956795 RepID=UPI00209B6F17|nr:tetratricopeptide repeat protein [Stieleria tagensis]MCO8125162.1 tetratricopeptide repeat protein [Stieleria tagensis]